MSTNLPPASPGGPEYLESGGGQPLQPPARDTRDGGGRHTALIAGGSVGVLALVGAGAWAAWSFFTTGPQPAEALPDSTIAYASVDLDPSGAQKIEALRTLRKFPAFEDRIGMDTDDDVRQRIFEEVQKSGACADVDYGDDIEPWLGDRMAVAAVDTGADAPTPVFVVQVTDEDAADKGLEKLRDCGGGESGAWSIENGWALVGESQDVVDDIAAKAADAPLADDDDFTHWTGEAGDAGIATFYVAPKAGEFLANQLGNELGGENIPPDAAKFFQDFDGLGATLRFDGGSLELEAAAQLAERQDLLGTTGGDDVLSTLPDDTAAAIGVGFPDGWLGDLVDQLASQAGTSPDDFLDQLSAQSGLDLPQDIETLAGESAALAVGSDFDPETFFNSSDGSGVPVGLKVQGDPEAIDSVLAKLRPQLGPQDSFLGSDSDGDLIAIGPDADYREQLLADGGLGSSEVFENVVREADAAAAIVFVNFDAGGGWLSKAAGDDQEVAENLDPLQGLGLSTWLDGDASHLVLRITTD